MKLLFGIYIRHATHDWWDDITGQAIFTEICPFCIGNTALEGQKYVCVPFNTKVDTMTGDNPNMPCSLFKKLNFKKL